jgi:hypothetical protein
MPNKMIKQSEIQSEAKSCQRLRREPPQGTREGDGLSVFGKVSGFLRILRATAQRLSLSDGTPLSAWVFWVARTATSSVPSASGDASEPIDKRLRFFNFLNMPENTPAN